LTVVHDVCFRAIVVVV